MSFKNIKIIETNSKKKIKLSENNLVLEPTDIKSAEWFENRLIRNNIKYVLVEMEMLLPDLIRYSKGYAIFTDKGEI